MATERRGEFDSASEAQRLSKEQMHTQSKGQMRGVCHGGGELSELNDISPELQNITKEIINIRNDLQNLKGQGKSMDMNQLFRYQERLRAIEMENKRDNIWCGDLRANKIPAGQGLVSEVFAQCHTLIRKIIDSAFAMPAAESDINDMGRTSSMSGRESETAGMKTTQKQTQAMSGLAPASDRF